MTTATLDETELQTLESHDAKSLPVRDLALQATILWLVTRAVLAVFTYFAVVFEHQPSTGPVNPSAFPPATLLMAWDRWDMTWYVRIALTGYDRFNTAGFFPLYPATVHVVSLMVGQSH